MKQEDILKYLLIAAGAYLVYEYVIKPMMASTTPAVAPASNTGTLPAGPTASAPGGTTSTTQVQRQIPAAPAASPAITADQIMALAGPMFVGNVDQWAYYWNQIAQSQGKSPISPAQMDSIMANAGVTADTRNNPLPLSVFMQAVGGAGLSGIVPAFSQLPPSMTFGKGFSSGFGMKRGSRSTAGSGMVN